MNPSDRRNALVQGINIRTPLARSSSGAFRLNTTTVDAVANNLRVLILTNENERPMQPDFGANLRGLIFEQGPDLEQQIKDRIEGAVSRWLPYVNLDEILVFLPGKSDTYAPNEARIKIKFSINGTKIEGSTEIGVKS